MEDKFLAFLSDPVRENFLRIREQILTDPRYEPYSDDIDDLQELFVQEKFDELSRSFMEHFPNLLLSPRLHLLAALAERKLGRDENADIELSIYEQCLAGILSTGDGSQESPYLVLRTSDIYDVLDHLDKEFGEQSLVHRGERSFDVMRCQDGSEYWFDITESFRKLEEQEALPEDFDVSE
jgi:Domain of unknown function (DUF4919)